VLCDSIDLPDELVAAQEQGRLVIFAGAGVSMGAPSNLPSFKQLTERIAENTGYDPTEPYDVFLGTLADASVNVIPCAETIYRILFRLLRLCTSTCCACLVNPTVRG